MTASNAWLSALAAEHMADLARQNEQYTMQAMNSDDGGDT